MVKKEFITLPLGDLIPYENNPRDNEDAVDDVVESQEQCGDLDPIEIDENNVILSGHTRLKGMYRRGVKTADVIRYTGLTEEQKKKYRLLANKTGEKAKWDFDKLTEELDALDFGDYDFGFDDFSIGDIGEVSGYGRATDERGYFEKTLTFPLDKKDQIIRYFKKHYDQIVNSIIEAADNDSL